MRTTQSLSITLPLEMAQMVKEKVKSGEFASESEVIRDGLRLVAQRDNIVERWLIDEVLPTLEVTRLKPERLISTEEAKVQLDAHIQRVNQN